MCAAATLRAGKVRRAARWGRNTSAESRSAAADEPEVERREDEDDPEVQIAFEDARMVIRIPS